MEVADAGGRPSLTERGHMAFDGQAFSHLIGARLTALSIGHVELRLDVRDDHRQQYGFVHGGVLAYLADNSLTFAAGTALDGQPVTLEMKLNYIRPATGELIIARAHTLSSGRTQAVARCEIFSVDGGVERLCAAGQGTVALAGRHRQTPGEPTDG